MLLSRSSVRAFGLVTFLLISPISGFSQIPVPTCTVTDIRGNPLRGTFCGGATGSLSCTAGFIYSCSNGPAGTTNNCKVVSSCTSGCLLGDGGASSCYTGATPLTISSLNPVGGSPISLTSQVSVPHAAAIINLVTTRGDLIPGAFCAVPLLANTQTTATWDMSTAAVTKPTPVPIYTNVTFNDTAGMHQLISPLQIVTLQPGGTEPPPPPLASFQLIPSTIAPSGLSEVNVTLTHPAPASGVTVALSSSDPTVAFPANGAAPVVGGSCLSGGGAFSIIASNNVPAQKTVTISATSGAAGEVPLTQPLTVTAGCVRNVCNLFPGGSCGPIVDGCGGTLNCGCLTGESCGGGGVAGVCGTPNVFVSSVTMTPSTIAPGQTSVGTITLNRPATFGEGISLSSNSPFVTVPSFVSIAAGATSITFVATASGRPPAPVAATITATFGAVVSTVLTVNPSATCVPTTCANAGKNCGAISDGCGGSLSCGSCTAPQSCGGAGIANVCGGSTGGGGGAGTAVLTLSVTGKGGNVVSTPAGLNVQSGKSGSATFTTGSVLTLKTDNGHGAIWSGLCSSAGKATQSCTFTVTATGSLTAVEQ